MSKEFCIIHYSYIDKMSTYLLLYIYFGNMYYWAAWYYTAGKDLVHFDKCQCISTYTEGLSHPHNYTCMCLIQDHMRKA